MVNMGPVFRFLETAFAKLIRKTGLINCLPNITKVQKYFEYLTHKKLCEKNVIELGTRRNCRINKIASYRKGFVSKKIGKNKTVKYFRVSSSKETRIEKSLLVKFIFLKNLWVGNSKENSYQRTFNQTSNSNQKPRINFTPWKVSKYGVFSSPNTGKHGPENTPYLDTFHAVFSEPDNWFRISKSVTCFSNSLFNPYVLNAHFLYPLKTLYSRADLLCFRIKNFWSDYATLEDTVATLYMQLLFLFSFRLIWNLWKWAKRKFYHFLLLSWLYTLWIKLLNTS